MTIVKRNMIDEIDDTILELLTRRIGLAIELGEMKKDLGIPVYDQKREDEVLGRLQAKNGGTLAPEALVSIWREIFSAARTVQTRLKVAYLGPEGTFTHQAVLERFGSSVEMVPGQTIGAVFTWLKNRTVDYAVLPVENTMQGVVGQTVDLLGAAGLPLIAGEAVLPIHFVFASRQDALTGVERIYSKQEAFPQCTKFLSKPDLERAVHVPSTSTSEAARQAAADPAGAALCPDIAANLAGVPIRFSNVENNARNKTRFLVLCHTRPERTGSDQTSVFAKVRNEAGGLSELIQSFSRRGINMTKIESRPMDEGENFESWFYITFDGHIDEPHVASVIREREMVWLGSYPRRREGVHSSSSARIKK